MTITLTERLRTVEGSRSGDYTFEVEVWRADVRAVCNLRVRLKVYRVRERFWFLPDARTLLYQTTEVSRRSNVGDDVSGAVEEGERLVEEHATDSDAVRVGV